MKTPATVVPGSSVTKVRSQRPQFLYPARAMRGTAPAMVGNSGNGRASGDLELGALIISEARRSVALDGKEIAVSRREFAILHALAERPGHVLSRSQLEDRIYGWQEEIESNAVEVHIHKLRAKLGRTRIETVRGEGYRITRS